MERTKMQKCTNGLGEAEHRRLGGVLCRVIAGLTETVRTLSGRYAKTHVIRRDCDDALKTVRCLRINLENAARREHPSADLIYPLADTAPTAAALAHAVATAGDDVAMD
jgi:hypothetical protein